MHDPGDGYVADRSHTRSPNRDHSPNQAVVKWLTSTIEAAETRPRVRVRVRVRVRARARARVRTRARVRAKGTITIMVRVRITVSIRVIIDSS